MKSVGAIVKGFVDVLGRALSAWGRFFMRRGWIGRLVWVAVSLVALACLCLSSLVAFVSTGQAVGLIPKTTPTATLAATVRSQPVVPVTDTPAVTRTEVLPPPTRTIAVAVQPSATRLLPTVTRAALTATARPASPVPPTAAPTTMASPTALSPTDTQPAPILVDTATAPPPPPTETVAAALGPRVVIVAVNKREEYVDIQNQGDQAQDLGGWRLVSERGNQACGLGGVLEASATLRIWAMTGPGGYNCNFGDNIWNNDESDPAVLYDNQGQEVSRR